MCFCAFSAGCTDPRIRAVASRPPPTCKLCGLPLSAAGSAVQRSRNSAPQGQSACAPGRVVYAALNVDYVVDQWTKLGYFGPPGAIRLKQIASVKAAAQSPDRLAELRLEVAREPRPSRRRQPTPWKRRRQRGGPTGRPRKIPKTPKRPSRITRLDRNRYVLRWRGDRAYLYERHYEGPKGHSRPRTRDEYLGRVPAHLLREWPAGLSEAMKVVRKQSRRRPPR